MDEIWMSESVDESNSVAELVTFIGGLAGCRNYFQY